MNTQESENKTRLVRQVKNMGGYARRFEDQYGVGILDIVAVFKDNIVLFIEAKMFDGHQFGPTDRQWIEGNRIIAVNGLATAILVGWSNNTGLMHVHHWNRVAKDVSCVVQVKGEDFAKTLWRYLNE